MSTKILQDNSNEQDEFLIQPLVDDEFLAYKKPDGQTEGKFRQEEGGVVWVSNRNPEGILCETIIFSKEQYLEYKRSMRKRIEG